MQVKEPSKWSHCGGEGKECCKRLKYSLSAISPDINFLQVYLILGEEEQPNDTWRAKQLSKKGMHSVTSEHSRWELSTWGFSKEITSDKKELKTIWKLTTYIHKLGNPALLK